MPELLLKLLPVGRHVPLPAESAAPASLIRTVPAGDALAGPPVTVAVKVTMAAAPIASVEGDGDRETVGVAALTVMVAVGAVAGGLKLASPAQVAVSVWLTPGESADVVRVATPELRFPVPSVVLVLLSMNVTIPEGIKVAGVPTPAKVAVRVTDAPNATVPDGLVVKAPVELALLIVNGRALDEIASEVTTVTLAVPGVTISEAGIVASACPFVTVGVARLDAFH